MPKFSEDNLVSFTKPPSDAEESKLANAEKMVNEAIGGDATLKTMDFKIFGQGSYANDTNVRLNSDIDINVRLNQTFFYELPAGNAAADFGIVPSTYSFDDYKRAIESALVNKFGRDSVKRFDKCITIKESPTRVETDVVPTFLYRRYAADGTYVEGVEFKSDSGSYVVNFPLQHIDNGKSKNYFTQKRFKRLTRVFRHIRYKMIDDQAGVGDNITSFLMECLVWNLPNSTFNNNPNWNDRLKSAIVSLYEATKEHENCKEWGEVSELLYLFHSSRKWTSVEVNSYLVTMWNYLGYA